MASRKRSSCFSPTPWHPGLMKPPLLGDGGQGLNIHLQLHTRLGGGDARFRKGEAENMHNVGPGKRLGRISPTPDLPALLTTLPHDDNLQEGQDPLQMAAQEADAERSVGRGEGPKLQQQNLMIFMKNLSTISGSIPQDRWWGELPNTICRAKASAGPTLSPTIAVLDGSPGAEEGRQCEQCNSGKQGKCSGKRLAGDSHLDGDPQTEPSLAPTLPTTSAQPTPYPAVL